MKLLEVYDAKLELRNRLQIIHTLLIKYKLYMLRTFSISSFSPDCFKRHQAITFHGF